MSLETVKLIFAQRYGVNAADLSEQTAISDVCTDSLDILELLMFIEDEFRITFPDDVAQNLKTLGDIAGYMNENIPEETVAEIRDRLAKN